MNSPVILLEKEIKVVHKQANSRKRNREKTAEFLISLALFSRVKKSETNQELFQLTLKQIISTLLKHSDEISRLSIECSKNTNKIDTLEDINGKMHTKIDSLLQKLQQLETEYSFEVFKNKQILQKHESLLYSISTSKTRYQCLVDMVLFVLAYRFIMNGKQKIGVFSLKNQLFSKGNLVGKSAEILALFFIFKTIKNTLCISSVYSR